MRELIQRQLLGLLDTVREGIGYMTSQQREIPFLQRDCLSALRQITAAIQDSGLENAASYRRELQAISDDLAQEFSVDRGCAVQRRITAVQDRLRREPIRLEIAFFPYKSSMWDCMESVWRTALADRGCDCYVVPIPYYDRNPDESLGAFHYEGRSFPPDVPIVDYNSYDVACRRPDICYIHNPYDECNLVSSVDPGFYSSKLKNYTDMLVYIPYYIAGYDGVTTLDLPAYRNADRIAVQSRQMQQCFVDMGIPAERILALGTPKLDPVINHQRTECPAEWADKLEGKTVFLVSTSLTDLLSGSAQYLPAIEAVLDAVLSREDCAAIWRPHPLTEATIRTMRAELLRPYQNMKKQLMRRDNFVLDAHSRALYAFDASHALFCDRSSIMSEFSLTGKPVYGFTAQRKRDIYEKKYCFFDCSRFYFPEDGITPEEFIRMVQSGEDPLEGARMSVISGSMFNADGTAGEKIHRTVVEQVRNMRSAVWDKTGR